MKAQKIVALIPRGKGNDLLRKSECDRLGRATSASGATLECATLVFGEATPHARVLAGLEGVLQADLRNSASTAHGFRLVDLVDCRPRVSYREK
jgi:hypothetical protein